MPATFELAIRSVTPGTVGLCSPQQTQGMRNPEVLHHTSRHSPGRRNENLWYDVVGAGLAGISKKVLEGQLIPMFVMQYSQDMKLITGFGTSWLLQGMGIISPP